jgi:hypothetical protein
MLQLERGVGTAALYLYDSSFDHKFLREFQPYHLKKSKNPKQIEAHFQILKIQTRWIFFLSLNLYHQSYFVLFLIVHFQQNFLLYHR